MGPHNGLQTEEIPVGPHNGLQTEEIPMGPRNGLKTEEIPVSPRNGLETGLSGNFLALMPDLFRWIKMISDYQGSEHTLGESKQNLPQ